MVLSLQLRLYGKFCDESSLQVTADAIQRAKCYEQFIIERILDLKEDQGRIMYLIKWSGFEELDNTWETVGIHI